MKKVSIFICIISILVILGGGVFIAGHYMLGDLETDDSFSAEMETIIDPEEEAIREESGLDKFDSSNIKNVMLFGIDSEDGDQGRSDSIMVFTVDNVHNKIKMTSLARDSLVYIPKKDVTEKLTHAYSYGGAAMAVATVNKNFNLGVKDYIAVNFSEMADIIDMVGGVYVDLTSAELGDMTGRRGVGSGLEPGDHVHLNGEQAVAYSRIRYIDTDDARQSRQREVLLSMFKQAKKISKTKYPSLIKTCMSQCKTSLGYTELLSLATIMAKPGVTVEQFAVPSQTKTEPYGGVLSSRGGAWCFVYNTRDASEEILRFIYEDIYDDVVPELPEATVTKDILTSADWANNVY